jgi:hypothetical protein
MMMGDIEPLSLPIKIYNGAEEQKGYEHPPPKAPEPQADGKLLYHGSCHCGTVTYTLLAAPITSANECTCSICWRVSDTRLGALGQETG